MIELDKYIESTPERTEQTDREFVCSLHKYDFEKHTKEIAKKLGLNCDYVRGMRKRKENDSPIENGGSLFLFKDVSPCDESVSGESLMASLDATIRRYLVAPDQSPRIMAAWSILTYLADDVNVLPMLVFASPTKRSGKTTALELIRRLSNRPIMASSITPAALFRIVDKVKPTLIIDEADTIFKENDDLRTLVNASFTRNAAVAIRVQGNDLEPRSFSTFSPKALALIGELPDTIADRSLIIPMRRKRADEVVERLRADRDMGFEDLRSKIARWVIDNKEAILSHDPEVPEGLDDRQADCWREIFRIVDVIGGKWPEQVRNDAKLICQDNAEDTDIKVTLLEDIRSYILGLVDQKYVESARIVRYLIELEDRPWAEWKRGAGLTTNALAGLLRSFSIKSKTVRIVQKTAKGYAISDFDEAFSRYLPSPPDVTT